MRDAELVASIQAGEPAALAEAYDKYAARLFSFSRALLGDPADAAGAVQDTFLITAAAVSGLHEPDRFRPWLYAVTRSQCHRRLRAGRPPASPDGHGDHGDHGRAYDDDDRTQLLDVVRTAIGGLGPGDREIIELNLRHRLYGRDLADTLCVPREHVHTLASRALGRLQESLGALLLAQAGRKSCEDLDELLGDQVLTPAHIRGLVGRHAEECRACGARQRQLLGPVMRLGFTPLLPIPHQLRSQVMGLATDPSPAARAERSAVEQQADGFGASGFPETPEPGAARRRRRLAGVPVGAIAGAGAIAAAAAVTAVLVMVLPNSPGQSNAALPAQLSQPISPSAGGSAGSSARAPVPGAAGKPGTTRTPAAGTQTPASIARIQSGSGNVGTLTVQGGSLAATSGSPASKGSDGGTPAGSTGTHPSSPGNDTVGSPPKTTAPVTTSPTPTTSTTPTTSPTPAPAPTSSTTPTDGPTATDPPTTGGTEGPTEDPTAGATIDVSVGQLVAVNVQLGS